jgi:hypothetical protein
VNYGCESSSQPVLALAHRSAMILSMGNFVVFQKRMVPLGQKPFVTIQKTGIFSLNQTAFQALGQPAAVEFLYDHKERVVGLRSVDANTEHAFAVTPVAKGANNFTVSGKSFVRYVGLDTSKAVRRTAYLEDAILCIDLKDEGVVVIGGRSPQSSSEVPTNLDPLGRPLVRGLGKVTRFDT